MRLDLGEESALLHQRDDRLARLETVEALQSAQTSRCPAVGSSPAWEVLVLDDVDGCIHGHDVDRRQPVPTSDLEFVEVMRGVIFDGAGSLLRVRILVGDDQDPAADQRQDDVLADEVPVALVLRVDGHACVAQHRLGSGVATVMKVEGSSGS